ncbi:MAG: cell division protein SepF [Lachnospiraceae bacterium]|nr:cell division protein SepF [Lachnospiraceae bacterium]
MGMMDGIKNRFHISGMIEDDDLDEDFDEFEDDDEFEEEPVKSGGLFGGLFKKNNAEPLDDEDDGIEEPPVEKKAPKFAPRKTFEPKKSDFDDFSSEPVKGTFNPAKSSVRKTVDIEPAPVKETPKNKNAGGKVVSMSKSSSSTAAGSKIMNELFMLKPKKYDDAEVAVDALLAKKVVIINIEGLNVEIAQYVTDFVTGANYSIGGNASTINNQVLIFTPPGVDLTGAFEDSKSDTTKDF